MWHNKQVENLWGSSSAAERLICNEEVAGSNPACSTTAFMLIKLVRKIKRQIKATIFQKLFLLFEKQGFYIIPNHFYFPVPDTKYLKTKDKIWNESSELVGIDMKAERQIKLLFFLFEV